MIPSLPRVFRSLAVAFTVALMLLPFRAFAAPDNQGTSNPGHVWVEPVGSTLGHEVPHLGCVDIAIWADKLSSSGGTFQVFSWPPTGGQEMVYSASWSYTVGGGRQVIATIPHDQLLAAAVNAGATANPTQGFHFKLEVLDTRGTNVFPGDHKSKTFWIDCAPAGGPGEIELFKVSSADTTMGLKGARFTATNEQTGEVFTLDYTNSGGFVTNVVPSGTYTLHEIIAPVGYFPAADITGVVVVAGQTTDLTIQDTPGATGGLSSLTIFKTTPTGAPLAGAVFTLADLETGQLVGGTQTTDATGHATFSDIPPFKYVLHEVSAPAGFIPAADIIVDVTNQPAQQTVVDQQATGSGNLEIFKADAANPSQGLKGARFTATNEATNVTTTLDWTNSGGFVTFPLDAGSYTVHESVPPVGYLPAPDVLHVQVLAGQTTDITVLDTAGSGPTAGHLSSLTVFKTDGAGNALQGAVFELRDLETGQLAGTPQTTDATGHATFTGVVPFKYTLVETTAPSGFATAPDSVVDVGPDPAQQTVVDTAL